MLKRKKISLPVYDSNKIDLPKRFDYVGSISWLKAVQEYIGEPLVFALDDALICQGRYDGCNDEFIIWVYGDDSLSRYNGVVVLENQIDNSFVTEKVGLRYTNFNRTLIDSINNEDVLDMQGITESLSDYFYTHNESFNSISINLEYQSKFDKLAKDAIYYYGVEKV